MATNNNQKANDVKKFLNYGKLKKLMEKDIVCKKCEEKKSKKELDGFTKYVDKHTNIDAFELLAQFKNKKKRANDIKLTRDTIGIFKGLTYKCKNCCKFDVPHKKIKW